MFAEAEEIKIMNIKLLRKIQKAILKEPRQFDMDRWYSFASSVPNCKTTACIAGWAIACDRKVKPLLAARTFDGEFGVNTHSITYSGKPGDVAAQLLGIDLDQREKLFQVGNWPRKYYIAYQRADTYKQRARIAFNRIGHFIKTGQ